ncbi:MAG: Na(+)-translocating NADH-quinone reductase subunit A [Dysgonamonadaceae bacterium]|jgi:Na+-transporting NADH:ubiquinone oxidoreductase subunit A|nr:Na(+)-translocating NADH-quinone reductase subunit A [Dysgonamonadaceae bacterium]
MNKLIEIKKGLDIKLTGKAGEEIRQPLVSEEYSVFPEDFPGFFPKVSVHQGDKVLAGSPVMFDKNHPEIKLVSPVSGEVTAVNRGEKRKLLNIVVRSDGENRYLEFGKKDVKTLSAGEITQVLAASGIFALIRQRPYDIVPNPDVRPRDIFVTAFSSAPLAPDADFLLQGEDADFQTGIDALSALTEGKVYLGIDYKTKSGFLTNASNAEVYPVKGPHPAGNAGVQINHIRPVNKGETVWTLDAQTVIYIGRLFNKGVADFSRLIAIAGSEIKPEYRAYYHTLPGVCLKEYFDRFTEEKRHKRYISGDVLTGTQIAADGFLHARDSLVTVIPEGDETNEFLGWISPGFGKFSVSHSYPSFILKGLFRKGYDIDARIRGGRRAMIMSEEFDRVFPMSILPEYLLRAIIAFDIEKMENLGIYEVAPEDFALCEFVDTSKMELQAIVREGLDKLYKEMV